LKKFVMRSWWECCITEFTKKENRTLIFTW
jgi:hypothetical protein